MSLEEAYKILELKDDKSLDVLKKAYRLAVKKYHPDQMGGNAEKFRKVEEAYELLKVPFYQDLLIKFHDKYDVKEDDYLYPYMVKKIQKMVLKTEKQLATFNNYDEGIEYLKNEFFVQYNGFLDQYIRTYINLYTDNDNSRITKEEGKEIADNIISNNVLYEFSIKEIDDLLNNSLLEFLNKRKIVTFQEIDVREIYNYYQSKLDNMFDSFELYDSYNDLEKYIDNEYFNTKRDIVKFAAANSKYGKDYLFAGIDHILNNHRIIIEYELERQDKYNIQQDKCIKYLNKLIKNKYIDVNLKEKYEEKIYNANNISVLYNIYNELYNCYYEKRVKVIKVKIDKKINMLIMFNKQLEEDYIDLKDFIWNILNKGISKEFLDVIEQLNLKDIDNTYDVLELYFKKEEENKKHR